MIHNKKTDGSKAVCFFVHSSYQLSNSHRRLYCRIRVHGLVRYTPNSLHVKEVLHKKYCPSVYKGLRLLFVDIPYPSSLYFQGMRVCFPPDISLIEIGLISTRLALYDTFPDEKNAIISTKLDTFTSITIFIYKEKA